MRGEATNRARRVGGAAPVGSALLMLGAALLAGGASAQDDDAEPALGEVRNCVDLRRIERTQIVDDDTILFRMRSGEVYRNDLQIACPGLRRDDTLMYRTALSQLCDVDTVSVLENMGFGFMPTATCLLGKFQPISGDEAQELLSAASSRE